MKTKSLSIFLVALFVVEMNLGTEENNNKNEEGEDFKYEIVKDYISDFNFSLKTILVGDSNVGKSALCNKICKNEFSGEYSPTVGFELKYLYFKIKNTSNELVLRYQIYDCCGQEKYRSLITNFYKDTKFFLLAYDVTNEESFKNIENWVNGVNLNKTEKHIHFVLIGTKIDLEKERKITKEKGEKFKELNNLDLFMEASAKSGINAQNIFVQAAKLLYQDYLKYQGDEQSVLTEESVKTMELSTKRKEKDRKKNRGGCC